MTELEKLFEQAKAHSWQSMQQDGGIYPTFFCHIPGNDGCGILPCLWDDIAQKNRVVGQVKAKFKELNVERFAFYGESWQTDRRGLSRDEPTPSDRHATRQEIIFVYAEERSGLSKAGWWPISESAGRVTLGDFVSQETGPSAAGGAFANMFGVEMLH
jgi:hypothetical protein